MPIDSVDSLGRYKKELSRETFIFLLLFMGVFGGLSSQMGLANMLNTMMNTAYQLLIDTVFYIMAIAVLSGALSGLFSEFGIVALMNLGLRYLMRPIYGLPGAAALGILTCYLSDNPAILTLATDQKFKRYFKAYQLPVLPNLAASFGMGLIITTFMLGLPAPKGQNFAVAALVGNVSAFLGGVIGVRLMLQFARREFDVEMPALGAPEHGPTQRLREIREGSTMTRFLDAMLGGGRLGVEMGMAIIPGVLTICTFVMLLTKGPSSAGTYTGAAFEGVALLPLLAQKLDFLLGPLFGLSSPENVAVPVTALGAAGAAIGLIPKLLKAGLVHGNDIAVFTAMCMCWSGFLSTFVAMMHALGCAQLTGKAILSQTVAGLSAGVIAHWLFVLLT